MNWKKRVKKDFEEKMDCPLTFDVEKLESNAKVKKPKWPRVVAAFAICIPLCIIAIPFVSMFFDAKESFSLKRIKYSIQDIALIQSSSFKNLNTIQYPSNTRKDLMVSEEYRSSFQSFTNTIYHQMDQQQNLAFSPMGLYSSLHLLSYGTSYDEINQLLGMDRLSRESSFKNMIENNYFANEKGTIQLSNATFLSNAYAYRQTFVDHMTDMYAEAYQMDFNNEKDVDQMLEWVNQKMGEEGFLKQKDLKINVDAETVLYLFSSLYFNNQWFHKFPTSSNTEDIFTLENQQTMTTTYMNNTYFGDLYDYGDFVSCFNYYENGLKIEYFVPKQQQHSIYDLTRDVDLFDKSNATYYKNCMIQLSVPRFQTSSSYDFSETLAKCGLANCFDKTRNTFNLIFENTNKPIFLDIVQQKNRIDFHEDGTIVKSLTISSLAAGSAGPGDDHQYQVNLNQPFIYIIYDNQSLPLFMGTVDRP